LSGSEVFDIDNNPIYIDRNVPTARSLCFLISLSPEPCGLLRKKEPYLSYAAFPIAHKWLPVPKLMMKHFNLIDAFSHYFSLIQSIAIFNLTFFIKY